MSEVSLNDVGPKFKGVLAGLRPGEEVGVFQDGQRIATIRKDGSVPAMNFPCKAGSAKGKILYMADDFDAPLDEFAEYM